MGDQNKIKMLQQWCKMVTDGYRDVDVRDMSTSWKSGLAFCAIIHKFRPDLIDYDSLSKENVFANNELAFKTAQRELGIPEFLDAEDMERMRVPDRLCIFTYVSEYYKRFHNQTPLGGPGVNKTSQVKLKEENKQPVSEKPTGIDVHVKHQESIKDICKECHQKVFLLERRIENGQLYHRSCLRKNILAPKRIFATYDTVPDDRIGKQRKTDVPMIESCCEKHDDTSENSEIHKHLTETKTVKGKPNGTRTSLNFKVYSSKTSGKDLVKNTVDKMNRNRQKCSDDKDTQSALRSAEETASESAVKVKCIDKDWRKDTDSSELTSMELTDVTAGGRDKSQGLFKTFRKLTGKKEQDVNKINEEKSSSKHQNAPQIARPVSAKHSTSSNIQSQVKRLELPKWKSDLKEKTEEQSQSKIAQLSSSDSFRAGQSQVGSLIATFETKDVNANKNDDRQDTTQRKTGLNERKLRTEDSDFKTSDHELQEKLNEIHEQLEELESRGRGIEEELRKASEDEEDHHVSNWLEIVHKRNDLIREEYYYNKIYQERKLELEQQLVDKRFRDIDNKRIKSLREKQEDEELIKKHVECVVRRSELVDAIEKERLKEIEEDEEISKMEAARKKKKKKKKSEKKRISYVIRRIRRIIPTRKKKKKAKNEIEDETNETTEGNDDDTGDSRK